MRREKLRFRNEGVQDMPSKLCCLGLVIIWAESIWETADARRSFWSALFYLKTKPQNFPWEEYPPVPGREEHPYHQKTESAQKWVWTNLLIALIFYWFPPLISPRHFPTTSCPSSNSFVNSFLHKFMVFLSKMYKSFLFWSLLQICVFLWRLLCTCKNLINSVFSSPVSQSYVSLVVRPNCRP